MITSSCDAVWTPSLRGDSTTPEILDGTLAEAGVGTARRREIHDNVSSKPARCRDGHILALDRPLPSPSALRDVACADSNAARGILGRLTSPLLDHSLAKVALDRLAEPAGADCPGLQGLSAEIAEGYSSLNGVTPATQTSPQ